MALAAKLQLRQSQSLVMTPQLMQSIRLLQLSHVELDRFVDEEIERNPLLERDERGDDFAPSAPEPAPQPEDAGGDWFGDQPLPSAEAMAERFDASLENIYPDEPGTREHLAPQLSSLWKSAGGPGGEAFDIADVTAAPVTLRDHLADQIAFAFRSGAERLVAADLADWVDEAGYMRGNLDEVAARLGTERAVVERVLATCQDFEPAGLFARDLSECLALQLARRDRLDPAMAALVANLELLARRDFATLRRICRVDEDDLVEMLAEIRRLDPRPGHAFSVATADPVVADVIVRPANDGGWSVELNPETLPRVLVDQVYYAEVAGHARTQDDRAFLADCLQSANWLTRSLDQRAKTILKVATEIVRQQDAFLVNGVRHLRPLNLRTVADAIGMHESTVSRVTANKYLMTPRGLFELRYFFTAAISAADGGDAHSSEAVRDRIRQMIEDEKPVDVLSDDAIVDRLKHSGIDIARRTVAKYREGMNIPSSVQRRREKRALAAANA